MPGYRLAAAPTPEQVRSESTTAHYGADGGTILGGEGILGRKESQLESPEVRVNAERDRAFAAGPVTLRDQGLLLHGDAAEISLINDEIDVETAHYVLYEQRLRGGAQRLERLEDGRYRLNEASF